MGAGEFISRPFCVIVNFMKKILAVLLLAPFLAAGCNWNRGPEELERLVKEDPAFRKMILERDQAHAQIAMIKQDLLKKKQGVDAEVEKLRSQYDLYAKTQNRKVEQYRAGIETNRTRLKTEIDGAETSIEAKQTEFEGYQKTLADVKKVLNESKGITLSEQEHKKWEERVLMLNEKMRPLAEEIQDLKLQISLKKQKISYLS